MERGKERKSNGNMDLIGEDESNGEKEEWK
jgi:hypothetical protein